jgi:hypothetical protein
MKKEPERVRNFVKLLTTPIEENSIDSQIEQFKGMADDKQKELILALENRPAATNSGWRIVKLFFIHTWGLEGHYTLLSDFILV